MGNASPKYHLKVSHLYLFSDGRKKYKVSCDTVYTALTGKRRPGGLQYHQKKKMKPEEVASTSRQVH